MKDLIKINAWNRDIALATEINQKFVVELLSEECSIFSPLCFENNRFADVRIRNISQEIDSIGIIADSINGAYGKGYFEKYYIDTRGSFPSMIDRLSFIGSNGLGALEYSPSDSVSSLDSKELYFSLLEFKNESLNVQTCNNINPDIAKLIAKSNSGAGGAKAKAVVDYNPITKFIHLSQIHSDTPKDYTKCIVKFNTKKNVQESNKYNRDLKLEYVYYLLAKECGIKISKCYLECDEDDNCYFITERFDVTEIGERLHMHSLAGLLGHNAESFSMGYEALFRSGRMLSVPVADREQMFKTMVFNLVFANRDDHSRNFSFLMDCNYNWKYSPSYDLTYAASDVGLEWHQLTIDKKPAHRVKSLALKKIALLCDIQNPFEIMAEFIAVKHNRLNILADEFDIPKSLIKLIFTDTKYIDSTFSSKKGA
jgi:serine/threonine-protein kinase HipA